LAAVRERRKSLKTGLLIQDCAVLAFTKVTSDFSYSFLAPFAIREKHHPRYYRVPQTKFKGEKMGAVINQINNVLHRFIGRILGFQSGFFELARGHHEITVPLRICPKQVWTQAIAFGTDGCGQFPVNKVGALLGPDNVILIVDIETDSARIDWFAVS